MHSRHHDIPADTTPRPANNLGLEKDPKTTKNSDVLEPLRNEEQKPTGFIETPMPARKTRGELLREVSAKRQTLLAKKVGKVSNENLYENVRGIQSTQVQK